MLRFEDHCLPLVQLKERRRELVKALREPTNIRQDLIAEIASVQLTIKAIEDVADDMADETRVRTTDDLAASGLSDCQSPTIASVEGDLYYEV